LFLFLAINLNYTYGGISYPQFLYKGRLTSSLALDLEQQMSDSSTKSVIKADLLLVRLRASRVIVEILTVHWLSAFRRPKATDGHARRCCEFIMTVRTVGSPRPERKQVCPP